jgi:hypothetical protein
MGLLTSVGYLFYIAAKEKNRARGLLSALSRMIECTEMECKACADLQMESTGAGRCCNACISLSPYSGREELLNELLPFVERLRESTNAASTTIITVALLQRSPQLLLIRVCSSSSLCASFPEEAPLHFLYSDPQGPEPLITCHGS